MSIPIIIKIVVSIILLLFNVKLFMWPKFTKSKAGQTIVLFLDILIAAISIGCIIAMWVLG